MTVIHGDCLVEMRRLAADGVRVQAIVTDPPYGLSQEPDIADVLRHWLAGDDYKHGSKGFMGKTWDSFVPGPAYWRAAYDLLPPGGHLVCFAGTRTQDLMGIALRMAGFEIRDGLSYLYDGGLSGPLLWCFGSGFPKSRNVSRDLDAVRCLCHMQGAASSEATVAEGPVLRASMRGRGEAETSHDASLCGLPERLGAEDALSGGEEPHLLSSMRDGKDVAGETGQAHWRADAADRGTVWPLRNAGTQAGQDTCSERESVLQPLLSGEGEREAPTCDGRQHERAEKGGPAIWRGQPRLERRSDLPAIEGELRGRSLGALSAGPTDYGDGERLHHGTSAGDGSLDRATTPADGVRSSRGPRSEEQSAQQPDPLAEQRRAQGMGAWPHCPRCGKPRIPDGLGSALKPAVEPIILARKPLDGTIAGNVLKHGVGGINVDACRVATAEDIRNHGRKPTVNGYDPRMSGSQEGREAGPTPGQMLGRWPANLLHDGSDEVEAAFAAFGERAVSGSAKNGGRSDARPDSIFGGPRPQGALHNDTGTASRFFPKCPATEDDLRFHYSAKASKADRAGSKHPTVKPVALMKWLCRLVTPPGGTVLDPFAGSGSTLQAAMSEGFNAIGIEQDADFVADARARLKPAEFALTA